MRLEWFRHHRQFVYWVLLPASVVGLAMFGSSGRGGSHGASPGPSIVYTVGDKTVTMSPGEVINKRIEFYKFSNRTRQPDSESVGKFASDVEYARQLGFEVGADEMKEAVRQTIKEMVRQIERDSTDDVVVDNETYTKLLQQLELSRAQFEQIVHDIQMQNKMNRQLYAAVNASDPELFTTYAAEEENVRIRFKTLKSEDFLKDVKAPTDDEIKAFHTKYTSEEEKKNQAYRDILWTEQKLSVDVFAKVDPKLFDLKPTEAELKKYYEDHKSLWKELPKADANKDAKKDEKKEEKKDEAKDPKKDEKKEEPKDTFTPFDKMKADVESRWKIEQMAKVKDNVRLEMNAAANDLKDAEKKFTDDKANAGKPFDVAAWAKSKNLTYWVTDELTKEQFEKGKSEINAKDFREVATSSILRYAPGIERQPEEQKANTLKLMDMMTPPEWLDQNKPELGIVMMHKKTFKEERTKTLDEAKDKIVEHLKDEAAVKFAAEEAKKLHDDWVRGEKLPKLEELDEVISEKNDKHPLVQEFRASPKAIGDVLDQTSGLPEDVKPGAKADHNRLWYYVGTVVERKLPSWTTFMQDASFKRKEKRDTELGEDASSIRALFLSLAGRVNKIPASEVDPPLGEALRRSQQSGDF